MELDILVRPAKIDDVAAVAKLHVDTWRTTYSGLIAPDFLSSLTYEEKEAQWMQGMKASSSRTQRLVATHDGVVAGFSIVGQRGPDEWGDASEMYALYVAEGLQGRGIGKQLFDSASTWAHDAGHDRLIIRVLKGNEPAIRFYGSRGAILCGEENVQIGGRTYLEHVYVLALGNEPEVR